MRTTKAQASLVISAPPEVVYNVIADYKVGHQAILPRPYFEEMVVEQGGYGEGTEIYLRMKVFGQVAEYHQKVAEPEPGRVIHEYDENIGQDTYFIIEPMNNGRKTEVTIDSTFPVPDGLLWRVQAKIQAWVARWLFTKELHNLAAYVQNQPQMQQAES